MGFKIWCQVGGGVTPFSKLPYSRKFSNIWFQKSQFFDGYHWQKKFVNDFSKNFKNLNCRQNLILKFAFKTHAHRVILKIILALTNFTWNLYNVPSGSRADLHHEALKAEFRFKGCYVNLWLDLLSFKHIFAFACSTIKF